MASVGDQRHGVEQLAEEFAERLRRGEKPSVDEYAADYPELADDIRELFPTIAALEGLRRRKDRRSDGRVSLGPTRPQQLGDFRILREIGRGGMGVVYEAEQESLRRKVAVKVLPKQSLLDDKQLRRFQREARTAARLHHTNIVPILAVGVHDGYHYYAMQLIEGLGIDSIISQMAERHDSDLSNENLSKLLRLCSHGARVDLGGAEGHLRHETSSGGSTDHGDVTPKVAPLPRSVSPSRSPGPR